MVLDLFPFLSEMEQHEKIFVQGLYGATEIGKHDLCGGLDPFVPFLDQQSEKQQAWLITLYEVYVEGYDYDDD